jgi:two-component system OmpR family response regulator
VAEATVLVVDDEKYIRDLVTSSLRLAGFTARAVPDGAQALAAIDRDRADLVILDVRLPGMDGFEVCRQLRADGSDIPVIFLTARDTPEDRLSGFTKGGDDYVTKPFSLEELIARVRAVLRRSRPADRGGSGCCRRRRSSTTSGSTTSTARAAWSRTTSPTCARRSTSWSQP